MYRLLPTLLVFAAQRLKTRYFFRSNAICSVLFGLRGFSGTPNPNPRSIFRSGPPGRQRSARGGLFPAKKGRFRDLLEAAPKNGPRIRTQRPRKPPIPSKSRPPFLGPRVCQIWAHFGALAGLRSKIEPRIRIQRPRKPPKPRRNHKVDQLWRFS